MKQENLKKEMNKLILNLYLQWPQEVKELKSD